MRLLLISRACSEQAGGMERLSYEFIQELQKIPAIKTRVICHRGTTRWSAIFFVLLSLPRSLWLARWADAVHLNDPVLAIHGWLIKKIWRKPVATTIHGLDVSYPNPFYQIYLRLFGQFDLCLPISQYAQHLWKKSKVSCQSSVVITPGIYDRLFDPSITREQLVALVKRITNYELRVTNPVLFTAGRLVKRKGHAWFIEHVLPSLPPNTVYVIAGDGLESNSIIERMSGAARPTVVLLGRVSETDLKILYNTVDAFIQPNIAIPGDAEGFGLVLLEAALCQRPVFASNLEGIPDAIADGRNGSLLPSQNPDAWINSLTSFLMNPQPAREARLYTLQRFNWSGQAKKYHSALVQALVRLNNRRYALGS